MDCAAAARSIIGEARHALSDPELTDAEAVHDVRKALKRWRALLRLLARPLGEPAEQMRTEARELMRSLSGARDAQSSLDALNDLRKAEVPISVTSLDTIRDRLTELKDAAEQQDFSQGTRERLVALPRLRDAVARSLAAQGDRFRHGGRRAQLDLSARAPVAAATTGRRRTPSICTTCAGAWSSIATRWI